MRRVFAAALLAAACATAPVTPEEGAKKDEAAQPAEAPAIPAPPAPWALAPPPPPLALYQLPAPKVSSKLLPSGLRVVVVEHPARPILTTLIVFPRGALLDPLAFSGMGNLSLELAIGLAEPGKKISSGFTAKGLRRRTMEYGGVLGHSIGPDASSLQIDGAARDIDLQVELLASAVREPRHAEDYFDNLRSALADQADERESSDPGALARALRESLFGLGHPYSRAVVGTSQSLRRIGFKRVVEHQARLLVPRGATILFVGAVQPAAAFDWAQRYFDGWEGTPPAQPELLTPRDAPLDGDVFFLDRPGSATVTACASRPLAATDGNDATLEVLVALLGEGVGSRLDRTLREEAQLTYTVAAELQLRRQGRALLACSPFGAANAGEGLLRMRALLERGGGGPPEPWEMERARAQAIARLDAEAKDAASMVNAWHAALSIGWSDPQWSRRRAALQAVTAAQVGRAAAAVLKKGKLRWIVTGERRAVTAAAVKAGMGKLVVFQAGE
jgi:predicted Zn-dependent peptidase